MAGRWSSGDWQVRLTGVHTVVACHPRVVEHSPSTARQARLCAAAARSQSCPTRCSPQTQARRPPWRRRTRYARRRSTLADSPGSQPATPGRSAARGRQPAAAHETDSNRATLDRGRTVGPQRTVATDLTETRAAGAVGLRRTEHGDLTGRAADRASVKVDVEAVLAEPSARRGRRRHLGHRRDAHAFGQRQVFAAAVAASPFTTGTPRSSSAPAAWGSLAAVVSTSAASLASAASGTANSANSFAVASASPLFAGLTAVG